MEAQMMAYRFQPVDLAALVRDTILRLAPLAVARAIRLEFKPGDELPAAKGDPARLRQLLDNLLGNALKYTEGGGQVWVALQLEPASEGLLRVEIHDTGCGIPQEALKTIFDKFHRIDRGQETERGTGLGLSIAKHIVAAHGGTIWATSQPGEGSVFAFTLPVT
jgi:signal transduction histidine kinase